MTTRIFNSTSYDVIVVGGRCAGAATAMLLARRGLKVLVLERSSYGTDTLSTHAIMRAGVLQLRRWGVLDEVVAAGTPAIERTAFHYGEHVVDLQLKERNGVSALRAPRRRILDRILVDGARRAGAEVHHGIRVEELLFDGDRVVGVRASDRLGRVRNLRARVVVGADGVGSTVARRVGASVSHSGNHASAVVYAYFENLSITANRWYYRRGASAGAVPTNGDQVLICAILPAPQFTPGRDRPIADIFSEYILAAEPELAARVAQAKRTTPFRGYAGRPGFLRQATGPGWALVGDAGYYVDPITAHGISDAFRDAEFLARAIDSEQRGAMREYEERRDELSVDFMRLTDRVASFDWSLGELQDLHLTLGKIANREERAIVDADTNLAGAA